MKHKQQTQIIVRSKKQTTIAPPFTILFPNDETKSVNLVLQSPSGTPEFTL